MNKNSKLFIILVLVVCAMATFGYANDRLFQMFCDAIGISQSPNAEELVVDPSAIDENRKVKVVFTTETMRDVPALFSVKEKSYEIVLGKTYENEYTFTNRTRDTLYVRPVHSVYPPSASNKYKMMKCFCFDDMVILPKQEQKLPLSFYFNTDVDPKVNRIVMHYSLIKRDKDDVLNGEK